MIQGFNLVLSYTALTVLSFTTLSTYAGLGNILSPRKVFTAIALFSFIRLYCVHFFVFCLLALSELLVAIKRIEVRNDDHSRRINKSTNYNCVQKLLLLPELSGTAVTGTNSDPVKTTSRSISLNLMSTAEPTNNSRDEVLLNDAAHRVMVSHLTASWTQVSRSW